MDEPADGAGLSRNRPNGSGSPPPTIAREGRDGLQMAPEFMLELARQAARPRQRPGERQSGCTWSRRS